MVAHVRDAFERNPPDAFADPGERARPVALSGAESLAPTPDRQGVVAAVLEFPSGAALPARPDLSPYQVVDVDSLGYRLSKRCLDVLVAAVGLIVLSPLLLMIAAAIVMTSPGPALFRQTRCGKDGKLFTSYKFRTMVPEAELIKVQLLHLNEVSGPVFKIRRDPRVTTIGRWLRKSSLDELPQLFNVLRGEMSLVGPRPSLPSEVHSYRGDQRVRLTVKPGLTCLWQISGRSNLTFETWVELDAEYVHRRNFWLDIRILLRTIPAVITGRGAF